MARGLAPLAHRFSPRCVRAPVAQWHRLNNPPLAFVALPGVDEVANARVRRLNPFEAVLACAVALAVVVALSWLVGSVGGEHGFDWSLAAVFGTALGTTLLALATGVLALLTWRDVTATQELARLTRDDQVERGRPVVITTGANFAGDATRGGNVVVGLVNVGLGPALRLRVTVQYVGNLPVGT